MRLLHFVRHAAVAVDPGLPSSDWPLAAGAEAAVSALATGLHGIGPRRIVSSNHRKATQTADILARELGAPVEVHPGLEEHHREQSDFFATRQAFEDAMTAFFEHPNETVLGSESAAAARARFQDAVRNIMTLSDDDEIVVSHGAVMALLLEQDANGSARSIWQRLKQPDHLTIEWPGLRIVEK